MGPDDIDAITSQLEAVEFHSKKMVEAASAVLQAENFTEGAKAVFDIAKELTGAQSGYVALLSEDGSENEVLFLDAGGLPCTVDESLPMPIRGLREVAYRENKPAYDNSFMTSEWMKYMPEGHVDLQNVMFGPLVISGRAEGLIGLANKPTPFTEEDAKTVMALSNLVAIGLRRAKVENELRVSRRKLLETATELDLYTSLLRHDLINDLQVIFGELDIAGTIPETDKMIQESLSTIESVSNRMLRLLKSLAKSNVDYEDDMREVIETVIQDAQHSYSSIKFTFHDDCEIEYFTTTGKLLLPFVFENLIRNASQHVPESLEIYIVMTNNDESIILDLVDNGPGIPEELRDTLFERGTSTKESGGLGLYLSRKIIETYGGKMFLLDNEYKKGAAFRIELPYVKVKESSSSH